MLNKKYQNYIPVSLVMLWLTFAILGILSFFMSDSKFVQEGEYAQLTIIIMSIIVIFCVFDNMKTKISKLISISGYCVMLLILMIDRYITSLSSGDADEFHLVALQKLNGNYSSNYGGVYTDILSIVYYFFGNQRIIGQYMNILVVITTEVIVLQILKILKYDDVSENICIAMLALSPNMLLYDSFLLREALIQNLIAFSLYWFIRWFMYNEKVSFFFSIFFALLACFFHSGCIATVIGYSVFFSLYDFSNKKIKFRSSSIIMVLILIIFVYVLNILFGNSMMSYFQTDRTISEFIDYASEGDGGAGYAVKTITFGNEIIDLIINTPIRIIYYLFSPMPWNWRGIKDIIAFFFSSLYYFFGIILAVKSIKKYNFSNKNLVIALLLVMTFSYIIFSWGVKNAGTAMRHRDKFVSVYILMTVISIYELNKNMITDSTYEEK